ncbi:hypothetical protein [Petrotoga sp. 9PWA.NaAc.5.4]|uniref:hypothetical protein n=1 Tax=Petrotoga sp. 9PWA.NaAc.5.4 TaxID=1434328 RepID=UPI000CB66C8E|nr:hypothetical protein [Petrotoga sp. 9PWA.NaAc.5.4]PNR94658.1 hypothetical protein X924_05975 [Petrotoga sp. 9PWA.NaAc.5.4]
MAEQNANGKDFNKENSDNKLEYEKLIENQEKTPKPNRDRIIIFSTLIAIIVLTVVIILTLLFFGKSYNITINYTIDKKEDVVEPFNKIKVELVGTNTYEATFPLNEPVQLKSIEEGTYNLNILAVDDNNIAYYYYHESNLFINEDKTFDNITLKKDPLIYSISSRWENNKLYITLPVGYEKYLVYRKNLDGKFELFQSNNQNIIVLDSIPSQGIELKFAVIKDGRMLDFSDSQVFQMNSNPSKPIVLSPTNNQILTENRVYFVWQAEDPDGDSLTFDLYLKSGSEPEKLIASNITNYFYEYDKLEPAKEYELSIVAKDGKGGESTSKIRFSTVSAPAEKIYLYSPSGPMGVTIYDVTNPNNPKEIAVINTSGNVTDVVKNENYLYILKFNEGIDIADVSNPSSPSVIGRMDLKGANGVKIANGYLYIKFTNENVGVYSLKENPAKPQFLGYTDIRFYGSIEPEIRYVKEQEDIKIDIIKGEYPVRINISNRVFITEFSVVVPNEEMKRVVDNSFARIFDTLRLVLSTYSVEDFKKANITDELEGKMMVALNELLGTNEKNGIKQVKIDISKVE